MGIKERRQREFLDREKVFLDAARDLIRDEGLLGFQMARLAELCEYSVGTLYQHFGSKEDLLVALTTATATEHVSLFARVADWQAPSRERLFAIAVADSIFVQRNPEYFRIAQYTFCEVVWGAASPARRAEFMAQTAEPISDIVNGIIADAVAGGDLLLGGLTEESLAVGFWALTCGVHDLVHAEGVCEAYQSQDPYRLLCRHTNVMLNGFGWKPVVDPHDEVALDALIHRIQNEVFHDLCDHA
ncbi:TetR/AcrR family transcriptional regulator [Polycyclovorans algicola]|uniref:TetR/AcrR family transcriptional regulator n=1 Tax=Polycyclovorans algicola TaxID=616992 RepID=UPI0004A6D02D|nr:TetR/AcrR family transcriptional regulator [Polycyclovorans algicola]